MFLFIMCVVFLTHAVHTMNTLMIELDPPFKLSNLNHIALDDLRKFNDFVSFQESFSKQAETLPHTLFKSQHLPDTCGFVFSAQKSNPLILWVINCVVSESQQTYITCAEGDILQGGEIIDVKLDILYH